MNFLMPKSFCYILSSYRDIDQLSDFSDHDLLGHSDFDGSDEEENTYYANTSKELARISGQHKWPSNQRRQSSQSHSNDSDYDNRLGKRKVQKVYKRNTFGRFSDQCLFKDCIIITSFSSS